jgi:hypothetical protein
MKVWDVLLHRADAVGMMFSLSRALPPLNARPQWPVCPAEWRVGLARVLVKWSIRSRVWPLRHVCKYAPPMALNTLDLTRKKKNSLKCNVNLCNEALDHSSNNLEPYPLGTVIEIDGLFLKLVNWYWGCSIFYKNKFFKIIIFNKITIYKVVFRID